MKELKGSKTEKHLLMAFAGESQARNRYTYFASQARKEGLEQIAAIFEETANQEKEHAKRFFGFLEGGELEITASFPAGVIGSTADNLAASAAGENHEHTDLYPEFAKIAQEEGFVAVAAIFNHISVAEKHHEERFRGLLKSLTENHVFHKEGGAKWRCRNCGYVRDSADAPKVCPACAHPQAYFEVAAQNW